MSLADDLLMSSVGMNSRMADVETEPHIIIAEDRFISVPDELKRIAVQYDHRAETVTFDCPRYWDGRDMSKMKIYINYTRADGLLGMYLAENVFPDDEFPDIMHFDWTLTRNVTGINGPIVFLVCAKRVDRNGNEEVHWNSERNTEMYVSDGLEGEEVIKNLYPDIFTQMLQRMDEIENITIEMLAKVDERYNEFVVVMEDTKTEVLNRVDELEASFEETRERVKDIEKIATPEAMQEYTNEYYEDNPESILDAIDDFFSIAVNRDIDDIINGVYVTSYNKFEDMFSMASDDDIDDVINNTYVGPEDDEEDDPEPEEPGPDPEPDIV